MKSDGGIYPDTVCVLDTMPDILYRISTDVVLFDFINNYCLKNPTIGKMEDFVVSDSLFDEFVDFIRPEMKFDSLSDLRKQIESDVSILTPRA